MSAKLKEVPAPQSGLPLGRWLPLEERNEGTHRSGKIAGHLLANWIYENQEILESDDLRLEYNYLSQTVRIQCLALPTHESLHIYFSREILFSLAERFGREQVENMVTVAGSGTTFSGFTGDGFGSSRKLPDSYIQLPGGKFPTIVCEAGWAESFEDLMQDARLWLLHTNGETTVVVVLAFTEEKAKLEVVSGPRHPEPITPTTANHDGTTHCSTSYHQEIQRTITSNHEGSIPTIMSKEVTAPSTAGNAATAPATTGNKATAPPTTGNEVTVPLSTSDEATTLPTTGNDATTPPTTVNDATAPPYTGNDSEEKLMHTIGENTDLNDLAEKLFTLHEQGKLQHPLLGKVHASLHIFKASNEGDDIVETFSTILLPPKAVGSTAPEEFGITLRDILGNLVPAGHDPADEVCFPLGKLQKVIKDAIPRTARLRATNRAEKLLRDTVGLDEELTFAQRKRQRLNLLGQWK